jgi:hypothetical protein
LGAIEALAREIDEAPAGDQESIGDAPGDVYSGERPRETQIHRLLKRLNPFVADHGVREAEAVDDELEEGRAGAPGLDQRHPEVGARDGHDDPGKAGSGPEIVGGPIRGRHHSGGSKAVLDVPLPEAGRVSAGDHPQRDGSFPDKHFERFELVQLPLIELKTQRPDDFPTLMFHVKHRDGY